jgi:glycosyltransferase involved in cell wall biosynthesis
LLADVLDSETYCNHLLNVVENDELRKRLGTNSSQHVADKFSYQRLVSDMSALYYNLLENKKR